MSKLLKYYLLNNAEDADNKLIIGTQAPYVIGKIWCFNDGHEFINFHNNYSGLAIHAVEGYKICIVFYTTITGKLLAGPGIASDLKAIMKEMCEFYYKDRVLKKPGKFYKYKL